MEALRMGVPKKILIVEKNPSTLVQMSHALSAAGYAVCEAESGREALRSVQVDTPDLVLAGLVLSDIGGRDLARILASNGDSTPVPTLVVVAPGTHHDDVLVAGGAPEQPVERWSSPEEIVTIVNRFFETSEEDDPEMFSRMLRFDSVTIDPSTATVTVNGEPIELTDKEFRFLHVIAVNGERTCTREELKHLVWGKDLEVIGRTVDVLVSRLRSKLVTASGSELISTVRGVGYRFTAERLV